MRNRQRGITLMGLLVGSVVLIFAALLGMKLLPAYIEFFSIKKAVAGVALESRGRGSAVNDLRRAFDARQAIDDFQAVKGSDLEITKAGDGYTVTAAYRKEVPLFANIGVYIDFVASN